MLPVVLCSYCCSSCLFFRFLVLLLHLYFFDRVWALFRQSLPCRLVVVTVFSYVASHTGCRRPPVLTSVLNQSWNTPLVCYCAAAFHASSFNLLYLCFFTCAICLCCCSVFSFDLCFCVLPSFCGGVFLYCFNDFFVFSSSGNSILMVFAVCELLSRLTVSCFLFISLSLEFFPGIDIVKIAMTHLWSLAMWIMSLASASLMCFKCLLFVSI